MSKPVKADGLARDLAELLGLSQAAGKRVDWAQAAGGNTSIKSADGLLLVKASGLRLDETTAQRGFVALDLKAVRTVLEDASYGDLPHGQQQDRAGEALLQALRPLPGVDGQGMRASLEAEFHALGERACLHVHLVEGLAALCQEDAREELDKALQPLKLQAAWADYRPPGHSLACLVRDGLRQRPSSVAGMANHGLIVWGATAGQALGLVERLQRALAAHFRPVEPPKLRAQQGDQDAAAKRASTALKEAFPHLAQRKAASDPWAQSLAQGGAWGWQPVCPDDVLYAGAVVPELGVDQAGQPGLLAGRLGPEPKVAVLALRDHGVMIAAKDARAWRAAHEILQANARARALARTRGQVRPLNPAQAAEILGMRGEQHRQAL